jgi:hypothetical protein
LSLSVVTFNNLSLFSIEPINSNLYLLIVNSPEIVSFSRFTDSGDNFSNNPPNNDVASFAVISSSFRLDTSNLSKTKL